MLPRLSRLPITLLLRHDAAPLPFAPWFGTLLPHTALGCAFPLASLCDAPSLWDAPPLPPPFFFLCRSPLTIFLLQVHRGPPLAVPMDLRPPHVLLTNTKRLDAATWFVFFFLFLFHMLTASFSFIHTPSCLRLHLVSHLSCRPNATCLPHTTCCPSSCLCHAAPFRSQTRGATLQPPSTFFYHFPFPFHLLTSPLSHMSLLVPLPRVASPPSLPLRLGASSLPLLWDTHPSPPGPGT